MERGNKKCRAELGGPEDSSSHRQLGFHWLDCGVVATVSRREITFQNGNKMHDQQNKFNIITIVTFWFCSFFNP